MKPKDNYMRPSVARREEKQNFLATISITKRKKSEQSAARIDCFQFNGHPITLGLLRKSGSIIIVNAVIVTRKEKEGVGALESDLTAFPVPLEY